MNKIPFSKMQSLGNDFIIIYETERISELLSFNRREIKKLSDRKTGIGADQILFVKNTGHNEDKFYYRIFNSDGGEVEQCGNGARCIKKFLFDKGFWKGNELTLVTVKSEFLVKSENNKDFVVSLNVHGTKPEDVGFNCPISIVQNLGEGASAKIRLAEENFINLAFVSMGNPHGVCWDNFDDNVQLKEVFEKVNQLKIFRDDINLGFCNKEDKTVVSLRVFERGVGETEACGSGACAAAVSGILSGILEANQFIEFKMKQGSLFVKWDGLLDSPVLLSGPATQVFDGEFYVGK